MFGRNVDFFAVLLIGLTMLGFAAARSWHWTEARYTIRVENAIEVERCPTTWQVLSNLSSIFH